MEDLSREKLSKELEYAFDELKRKCPYRHNKIVKAEAQIRKLIQRKVSREFVREWREKLLACTYPLYLETMEEMLKELGIELEE